MDTSGRQHAFHVVEHVLRGLDGVHRLARTDVAPVVQAYLEVVVQEVADARLRCCVGRSRRR